MHNHSNGPVAAPERDALLGVAAKKRHTGGAAAGQEPFHVFHGPIPVVVALPAG